MFRGVPRGKALPRPMLPALGWAAALGPEELGLLPLCSHAREQDLNGISYIMLTKGCPLIVQMLLWKPGGGAECSYMLESSSHQEKNTWIELELCFHAQVTNEQIKQQDNAFARVMRISCHQQLPNQSSPLCWHGAVTTPGTGTPWCRDTEAPRCASLLWKSCWLADRHQTKFLHPSSFKP